MSQRDGYYCPGCGLPNYQGLCPHCRGDQSAYEEELAPYFGSSLPDTDGLLGNNSSDVEELPF